MLRWQWIRNAADIEEDRCGDLESCWTVVLKWIMIMTHMNKLYDTVYKYFCQYKVIHTNFTFHLKMYF